MVLKAYLSKYKHCCKSVHLLSNKPRYWQCFHFYGNEGGGILPSSFWKGGGGHIPPFPFDRIPAYTFALFMPMGLFIVNLDSLRQCVVWTNPRLVGLHICWVLSSHKIFCCLVALWIVGNIYMVLVTIIFWKGSWYALINWQTLIPS